jgi:hypothetical protein
MNRVGPNGRCLKDQMPKSKPKVNGGRRGQRGNKITWNVIWRENLISLTIFLMPSHTTLKK